MEQNHQSLTTATDKKKSNFSIFLLLIVAVVLIFAATSADPDLWGHVRFGIDILESGEITRVDPYSYNSGDQPWINHEWLTEVIFAVAWLTAKDTGLIILKLIVGLLTVGLLIRHLLSLNIKPVEAVLILFTMGTPYLVIQTVRPQIFTFLFYTITMLIIYRAEKGDYRWLWAAPILIVFWTNLHGGFLSGLGILVIWSLAHLFFNRNSWKKVLPPIILSILAPLVNPYGFELIIFLLTTATVPRPEISDWGRMELFSVYGVLYGLTFGISVLGLVFSPNQRKPVPIFLFGVTMLLPWVALRLLPMFSITSIVLISEYVTSALNKVMPSKDLSKRSSIIFGSLGIAGVIALIVLSFNNNLWQIRVSSFFPDTAVSLIKQSKVAGNLATDFNWGEYILWHLGPEVQVSIDGRRETVYSEREYQQYLNFINGREDWDELIESNWTDMVLIRVNTTAYKMMKLKPGWLLVFEDDISALFVNEESPLADTLQKKFSNFDPPEPNKFFP